jgi:RecB family exonuclease
MSFLEELVADLKAQFGDDISRLCLVVPSRRAVMFLRQALAKVYRKTIWAPQMVSIQDLVREVSGKQFPDTLPLVFELYQVYIARMRQDQPAFEESFEQFYTWGEMLVKDFDELDKYLVDARQLFTNVKELREIDDFFSLPEENKQSVLTFWKSLRGEKESPTEMQERFLRIWQVLYDVYAALGERLRSRNLAYDGMAYRDLVNQFAAGEYPLSHDMTIFVGFNALSAAEEKLMHHLLKEEQAQVYWDVDRAYFSPPDERRDKKTGYIAGEEPGKFIREYHKKWRGLASHLIVHDMAATPKKIILSGVPLQVGQAQYLGNLLQAEPLEADTLQEYALVLADENLLFPVLYALPDRISQLNIPMGFRLKQTQIYHLLLTLMLMLNRLRVNQQGELLFPYQEVLDILNNPYLKAYHPELSEAIQQEISKKNLIHLPQSDLQRRELSPLLAHLFDPPRPIESQFQVDVAPLLDYVKKALLLLLEDAQEREAKLEVEYIFHFYQWFLQLEEVIQRYQARLSLQGFTRLVRETLQKVRIPFEGEPLVGVQVMGFLETRVLDFKKVYILAANEGSLPDTSSGNSFIPYNLRRGFGLPTYQEKDAIYAYHFYRLLQRTEEIHLIYNSIVNDGGGVQEVSRFIRQIRHFFRDIPHLKPEERLVSPQPSPVQRDTITISAQPAIETRLQARFFQDGKRSRYFSATALTTYLTCPLRFYYRYVADIQEPNAVEEIMEANTFGSVLHRAMEYVYEGLIGPTLSPTSIAPLPDKLEPSLRKAFADHQLSWGQELRGKNYLLRGVIRQLCEKILALDQESEPFQILSLEDDKSYQTELIVDGQAFHLNGTFDRLDYLPEQQLVRILDYKTGKVELNAKSLEECFSDPKYKAAFQGYLYAWLYRRKNPEAKVQVGFFEARTLGGGIRFLEEGKAIEGAVLDHFEQLLIQLIRDIRQQDFSQTEDERACSYCAYNVICNRGKS